MTSERVCDDFLAFFAPSPDWSLFSAANRLSASNNRTAPSSPPRITPSRMRFAQLARRGYFSGNIRKKQMTWTTPTLVEICIGLEINGYLPAEF